MGLLTLSGLVSIFGVGVGLFALVATHRTLKLLSGSGECIRSWKVARALSGVVVFGSAATLVLALVESQALQALSVVLFALGVLLAYSAIRAGVLTTQGLISNAQAIDRKLKDLEQSQRALQAEIGTVKPVLDSVKMGILIIDVESSRIVDANPSAVGMIGAPKERIVGSVCHNFVCLAEQGRCPIIDLGQTVDNAERVLVKANGDRLPIVKTVVCSDVGGRQCLIESFFDITPQKRAEQALKDANVQLARELNERARVEKALRESDERYALAVRGANDGLWDWDLESEQVYYSPRWKSMLGYSEEHDANRSGQWFDRVHPDDLPKLRESLAAHLDGRNAHFECEYRIRHYDGQYRWVLCRGVAMRNGDGKAYRIAGSQSDITRQKTAEEQLAHDALHDPLTGLPNRVLFMDRLEHSVKRTRGVGSCRSAVLFLDLDRFKWINDSLGHSTGDELLACIAERLNACTRPGDTVARFGGDEFAILLEGVSEVDDSTRVAERIKAELRRPFSLHGHEITVSASIGIAGCRGDGPASAAKAPDEILRDADTAMYRAKSMGRARYELFDTSMHAHAVAVLHMEEELRRAVECREFVVYYQPIVLLRDGAITAVEALLRWRHPTRGLVQPNDFLPMAEETGLIVPIGEFVIRTACAQVSTWHAQGHSQLQVAANCSARQFQDPNLAAMVSQALEETGLPPHCLQIEITESTAMNDGVSARALAELSAMGVQISLDDFGDGHSALGNLKHLPLSILKIDQSLLRGICLDSGNAAIATAIIAMARSLKLRAIAEGVETDAERDFLRGRQCEEAQGYLFSRPVPAEALAKLLHGRGPVQPDAGAPDEWPSLAS